MLFLTITSCWNVLSPFTSVTLLLHTTDSLTLFRLEQTKDAQWRHIQVVVLLCDRFFCPDAIGLDLISYIVWNDKPSCLLNLKVIHESQQNRTNVSILPVYLEWFVFSAVCRYLSTNISQSDPWPPLISQRLAPRKGRGKKKRKRRKRDEPLSSSSP